MNIKEFVFEDGQKRVLYAGMALGIICLAISFLTGDEYKTEFWTNWLHNSVFFTGIAFTAVFFLAANIVGFAGWMVVIKRVWESMGTFLLPAVILLALVVVGIFGHMHHLYHWNAHGVTDPASPHFDKILFGKKSFLSPFMYTLATVGFVTLWYFIAKKLRDTSIAQDDAPASESMRYYKKTRNWASFYLPVAGFLSPFFFWLTIMSIDPHWYSTMYAWYSMISAWVAALCLTMLIIIYLKSKGYMDYVTRDHLHDVGKFMFGISVFWSYLWFDQFMLIWYANNGEETIYFKERLEHYPVLFFGNLLLNFVTPFFVLMRNDNKRKYGTLTIVAIIVFFGHWWDFFYMIKPGARVALHEARMASGEGHGAHAGTDIHVKDAVSQGAEVAHTAASAHTDVHAGESHAEAAHTAAPAHTDTHAAESHAEAAHTAAPAHTDTHSGDSHGDAAAGADGHGDSHGAVLHSHGGGHGDKSFKLGYTIPGFLELGTMIGFLSFFLFMVFRGLASASLFPKNDPFLEEALHHATGAHIDSEIEEAGGAVHH